MSTDKITVIIPVYNVEHYLDRCVNSVLQQSYSETEILLIDDGSTDSSGIICDRLAETDPRIRVIHKENSGVSEARNTGLDFATGDFIAFVDSDDYLDVDTLKKLYAALKENDAEMSMCVFLYVDDNGVPVVGKQQGLPITDEVLSGFEILTRMHTVRHGKRFVHVWGKYIKEVCFLILAFQK